MLLHDTNDAPSPVLGIERRGTLGGTQYRNTVRKIGKYRNTDTAFMIGDAYLMLYPSRVFFFYLSLYTTEMNLSLRDET